MYPDLSYFLHDLFGTAVDNWTSIFKTFGLFLGISFFASAYVLYLEFKRKEKEGLLKPIVQTVEIGKGVNITEVILNALIGFVFGFKIPLIASDFEAFKENAAGIVFSTDGNFAVGILVFAIFAGYYYWQGNKNKLPKPQKKQQKIFPHQRVGDITIVAAIFGIIGSRLFSLLENLDAFLSDPIGQLFSGSGLTIYGGLILAFIAVYLYVKKIGIPPIHVMDSVAPALIMGYAVGRLGCHFSGDGDWGIINEAAKPSWFFLPDWMWSYDYPRNVLADGIPIEGCEGKYCNRLSPGVFPTPFYETFLSLVIFSILWFFRKRLHVAGTLFFLYCFLNGIERVFIEGIRVNERYEFMNFNLSQAQYIAIGLILTGIIGYVYLIKKDRSTAKASSG